MMDDKDRTIKKLEKKIKKLTSALDIVVSYSGKEENQMRKQFTVISETIPVPMIISKENGEVVFANLSAQRMFGYSPDNFKEATIPLTYKEPEDRNLFLEELSKLNEISGFRVDMKRSEGTEFPAELYARRIQFDGQDCILTVVHDLTEVMKLEHQLRQVQKMEAIGTLAGGIAHDFNNILQGIFTSIQLARKKLDEESEANKFIDRTFEYSQRAADLVKQILTFSRKSEQKLSTIQVVPVLKEVLKMMRSTLPTTIKIEQEFPDTCNYTEGNLTQIHQVVMNLCTNAGYAMRESGGTLGVYLSEVVLDKIAARNLNLKEAAYLKLTISDTGTGMPPEMLEHIFDPFYTTKPLGEGTGLGLAVVHGIIHEHKGAISVESEIDKGSRFEIYFPVIQKKNQTRETKQEVSINGKEHLLLVDDEEALTSLMQEELKELGYQVTPAYNGRQALDLIRSMPQKFDLVITDQTMPEMTGYQLAKALQNDSCAIPIILISGFSHAMNPEKNRQLGIKGALMKPFDRDRIGKVIRKVLDTKQQ